MKRILICVLAAACGSAAESPTPDAPPADASSPSAPIAFLGPRAGGVIGCTLTSQHVLAIAPGAPCDIRLEVLMPPDAPLGLYAVTTYVTNGLGGGEASGWHVEDHMLGDGSFWNSPQTGVPLIWVRATADLGATPWVIWYVRVTRRDDPDGAPVGLYAIEASVK
jgi:hypothetical protein